MSEFMRTETMQRKKLKIAVCISGTGSTLKAILRACKDGRLPCVELALVISSQVDALGIQKALQEGMLPEDIIVIERKKFNHPLQYGDEILRACQLRAIELIALCGFLPIMPVNVVDAYAGKIVNLHPGPLDGVRPSFGGKGMYGIRVHHAVLYFARRIGRTFRTEATIHHVSNEVDGGALIDVCPVQIMEGDTAETLADRVLQHEHELIIETLLKYSEFGNMQKINRQYPLILAGEEQLLIDAKNDALLNYES